MQPDGGTERGGAWFSCSLHRVQIGTSSYLQQQDYNAFCRTETEKPAVFFPAGLAIGVLLTFLLHDFSSMQCFAEAAFLRHCRTKF